MRVVNNLAKPGDIRRVDLTPDIVRVQTYDGRDRVYRIVSDNPRDAMEDNNVHDDEAHSPSNQIKGGVTLR